MEYVLLLIPVVFLVGSVSLAIWAVKRGTKTRKAAGLQLLSFLFVCILTFAAPMIASAAEAADTAPAETPAASDSVSPEQTADSSKGLGLLAAALVTGLAGIGGGIAVAAAAPAAIGATSEDPKAFGKALIFVSLGEGIAIYGLLISILILNKV